MRINKTRLHWPALVVLTAFLLVAMAAVAVADTFVWDGDIVTAGNQTTVDLGTVSPGAALTSQVSFQLQCAGKQHADEGQTVNLAFNLAGSTVPAGGLLSAAGASIGTIPASWPDDTTGSGPTNCPDSAPKLDDNGNSTVTLTAPTAPGSYTFVAAWTSSMSPAGNGDPQAITGPNPSVTFTLTVAAPSDTTPPVLTVTPPAATGSNGWFKTSPVSVDVTATDASGIASISCTPAFTKTGEDATSMWGTVSVSAEGTTTVSCTATDKASPANTTAPVTADVKIDTVAPTISASVSPARPASGWWNIASGAPTVSFTCSDAISGLAGSCPAAHTFVEGEDQSYSQTIYDNAGNSASAGVGNIDVDLTAASVIWSGGPAAGGSYYFEFVPGGPTCTAADSLSGPDGCEVTGYGTTVGSHTMTATAYDVAGNSKVETRTYTVLAWTLTGFYRPVDMNGVWNTVKGGSTVPLKFEVFAGSTELTDVSIIKSFTYRPVACDSGGPSDPIEEVVSTGGTSLRYDFEAGQFIQNWKTPRSTGCYSVTMTTRDGSTLTALFKLK